MSSGLVRTLTCLGLGSGESLAYGMNTRTVDRRWRPYPKKARVPSSASAVAICPVPGSNDRIYPYEYVAWHVLMNMPLPSPAMSEEVGRCVIGKPGSLTSNFHSHLHLTGSLGKGKKSFWPPGGSLKQTPTSGKQTGQTIHSCSFFPSFQPISNLSCIYGSEDFEDEQKEIDTLNHTDLSIPPTVNLLMGPKCVK